jgi:hypothetical protein
MNYFVKSLCLSEMQIWSLCSLELTFFDPNHSLESTPHPSAIFYFRESTIMIPDPVVTQKLSDQGGSTKFIVVMSKSFSSTASLSKLYVSCADGNANSVSELLSHMPLEEIDRFEPNGNTALHVACSNGHEDIVRLLLEKGAAHQQRNRFSATPLEETRSRPIQQLFHRNIEATRERFVIDFSQLDWISCDFPTLFPVFELPSINETFEIHMTVIKVLENKTLQDTNGMNKVIRFMAQAAETNDSSFLIRACTAETDFYKRLNKALTDDEADWLYESRPVSLSWHRQFVMQVRWDENMAKYYWRGISYLGMQCSKADFGKYVEGKAIKNKTFLSTTESRQVVERLTYPPGKNNIAIIWLFIIRDIADALDVHSISEYPEEQEVIILPHNIFTIAKINMSKDPVEIVARQVSFAPET